MAAEARRSASFIKSPTIFLWTNSNQELIRAYVEAIMEEQSKQGAIEILHTGAISGCIRRKTIKTRKKDDGWRLLSR